MPNLTNDESLRIAQMFRGFATAVDDYRFAHLAELTDSQASGLQKDASTLRKTAGDFVDQGINRAIDDVQAALAGLGQVTDMLKSNLEKLGAIDRALGVVTSLVQLGAAFATGNPGGIASALASTVSALQPAAKATG